MDVVAEGNGPFEAEIRWTTHGVAHVRAADWGGLGFGQGFACARDNLPTIADQIVKVRSERARHLGAGPDGAHLASDFGYLALGVRDRAVAFRDAQLPWVREMITGYVEGYNTHLRQATAEGTLPEWCAGAPWIRPIDEVDYYSYLVDVALMASGRNLVQLIGRAEAPGPDGPSPVSPSDALGGASMASNGWALGRDVTASGHGMVLANPHFPWYGEARFWECHLNIPGTIDVYGAALIGLPGVQIGFNEGVAWAHTFSAGYRFTMYRLDLVGGRPTAYRYGDDEREMTPTTHRVSVTGPDAELTTVERTLWRSHHGPMLNLPILGWGLETGFTYRDANFDNDAVILQFLSMDRARDLDEFRAVYHQVKGLPWVNTLAADRSGRVWYTDASATPRIGAGARERLAERLATDLVAVLLADSGAVLLDGSDPDDEWLDVPGARSPGLEPPDALPELERTDFVLNANDSHWSANPAAPLEGYSPLGGPERSALSLRTRRNLTHAAALADRGGVTVGDVIGVLFANRSYSAELLVDEVIRRCRASGPVTRGGVEVDPAVAAEVLAAWDGCTTLGSRGAALWRETIRCFSPKDWTSAGVLFAVPFDPADPVHTPRGLVPPPAEGPDPVVGAVVTAMGLLAAAGVSLDAPLGDVQWVARGDERVPIHGGHEADGVMNMTSPTAALARGVPVDSLEPTPAVPAAVAGRPGLGDGGYQVDYGASFLMAVELTDDGPRGVGVLAYGQTSDPTSPHHRDGTEAFAAGRLRPLLFRDADIDGDPALVRRVVRSAEPAS